MNRAEVLCACGCGQLAPIATKTRPGAKKGEPQKYVRFHVRRKKKEQLKTYRRVLHSGVTRHLHVVRAELALGKPLPVGAEVHHADGTKRDDAPLVICQDRAYHMFLHMRMRIRAAGGNPNSELICCRCKSIKPFSEFSRDKNRYNGMGSDCRDCNRAHCRAWHDARRAKNASANALPSAPAMVGA